MSSEAEQAVVPRDTVRIMLRPVASSLPLGFFAFGTGTVLLSALELHWVPVTDGKQLMLMVLAFVVPLELISGIFAFLARDHGAATGLTLLSAAWTAIAITVLGGSAGTLSSPLAVFLLTLTPVMLLMTAASMQGKPLFGVLLLAGACRFALTGAYEASGVAGTEQAAGWLGIPLAVFALYGGLALLLEEGSRRTVLPLGRRGTARISMEGDLERQIQHAGQEPGVRRSL